MWSTFMWFDSRSCVGLAAVLNHCVSKVLCLCEDDWFKILKIQQKGMPPGSPHWKEKLSQEISKMLAQWNKGLTLEIQSVSHPGLAKPHVHGHLDVPCPWSSPLSSPSRKPDSQSERTELRHFSLAKHVTRKAISYQQLGSCVSRASM